MSEFVTLDGVMEAPGGEPSHPHTNWVGELPSDEQGQYKFDEVVEAESLLLGRVTYESFSGAWHRRSGVSRPVPSRGASGRYWSPKTRTASSAPCS